jgi:hypothetical protein
MVTNQPPPREATHWSSAPAMAKAVGISPSSVRRIWAGQGLQPHRVRTFKISNDPNFADKLKDVVGLLRRSRLGCIQEDDASKKEVLFGSHFSVCERAMTCSSPSGRLADPPSMPETTGTAIIYWRYCLKWPPATDSHCAAASLSYQAKSA